MTLEPLLPSEQIELAIYRSVTYFGQEWTTSISSLLQSIQHFGVQATNVSVVERLENLEADHNIDLTKWAGGRSTSRSEWGDAEKFFYVDDFKIAITPVGRKYFESLERREKLSVQAVGTKTERSLVFISCGQASEDERSLGRAMAKAVEELTGYEGYFAQNQTSLQGLSQHILGALNRCAAFVAVLHHRGHVKTPHGEHIRASVWVEQEIAIAAARVHAGDKLPVLIYIQNGIKRQGLRDLLMLNPVEFETENEVIEHFRNALSSGQLKPLAASVKDSDAYEQAKREQFEEAVSLMDEPTKKVLRRVVEHDSINEFNLIQEFGPECSRSLVQDRKSGYHREFQQGRPTTTALAYKRSHAPPCCSLLLSRGILTAATHCQSSFGLFLLPFGLPRRLIVFIHAGGRPRRFPRPAAIR